jgi:hypothetical protein
VVWRVEPLASLLLSRCSTPSARLPDLLCFNYFSDTGSQFGLEWPSEWDPLTYASCIAGIIGIHHHCLPSLFGEMGILLTFCLGWPQTVILPISTSQVVWIISMNHHAQPPKLSVLKQTIFYLLTIPQPRLDSTTQIYGCSSTHSWVCIQLAGQLGAELSWNTRIQRSSKSFSLCCLKASLFFSLSTYSLQQNNQTSNTAAQSFKNRNCQLFLMLRPWTHFIH